MKTPKVSLELQKTEWSAFLRTATGEAFIEWLKEETQIKSSSYTEDPNVAHAELSKRSGIARVLNRIELKAMGEEAALKKLGIKKKPDAPAQG